MYYIQNVVAFEEANDSWFWIKQNVIWILSAFGVLINNQLRNSLYITTKTKQIKTIYDAQELKWSKIQLFNHFSRHANDFWTTTKLVLFMKRFHLKKAIQGCWIMLNEHDEIKTTEL